MNLQAASRLWVCVCVWTNVAHTFLYIQSEPMVFHRSLEWSRHSDTPPHTHLPTPWSLYSCAPGADFTLAVHESGGQGGVGGEMAGGFHAVTEGSVVLVDSDTKHTAWHSQTDRAATETLEPDKLSWPLWEWEGGGGVGWWGQGCWPRNDRDWQHI